MQVSGPRSPSYLSNHKPRPHQERKDENWGFADRWLIVWLKVCVEKGIDFFITTLLLSELLRLG